MSLPRSKSSAVLVFLALFSWGVTTSRAVTSEPQRSTFLERMFNNDVTVITVTDFTPEGKKLPQASKENPVYFEALILGYNDWGRPIAGEKVPDKKLFIRLIFKVLAEQGYYPCNAQHKPTIILALAWGSMNNRPGMSLLFMGGDKLDVTWELNPYIGGLLDPRVLTRATRSGDQDLVLEASDGNLYVASIQAFDEEAALKYETKLLWHTKISCPADGLSMDTALRQMIRTAGPLIGRETDKPVIRATPQKSGTVEIGELKVLESIDTTKLPITDRTIDDKATPAVRK